MRSNAAPQGPSQPLARIFYRRYLSVALRGDRAMKTPWAEYTKLLLLIIGSALVGKAVARFSEWFYRA